MLRLLPGKPQSRGFVDLLKVATLMLNCNSVLRTIMALAWSEITLKLFVGFAKPLALEILPLNSISVRRIALAWE